MNQQLTSRPPSRLALKGTVDIIRPRLPTVDAVATEAPTRRPLQGDRLGHVALFFGAVAAILVGAVVGDALGNAMLGLMGGGIAFAVFSPLLGSANRPPRR